MVNAHNLCACPSTESDQIKSVRECKIENLVREIGEIGLLFFLKISILPVSLQSGWRPNATHLWATRTPTMAKKLCSVDLIVGTINVNRGSLWAQFWSKRRIRVSLNSSVRQNGRGT